MTVAARLWHALRRGVGYGLCVGAGLGVLLNLGAALIASLREFVVNDYWGQSPLDVFLAQVIGERAQAVLTFAFIGAVLGFLFCLTDSVQHAKRGVPLVIAGIGCLFMFHLRGHSSDLVASGTNTALAAWLSYRAASLFKQAVERQSLRATRVSAPGRAEQAEIKLDPASPIGSPESMPPVPQASVERTAPRSPVIRGAKYGLVVGAGSGVLTSWAIAVGGFLLDVVFDIEPRTNPFAFLLLYGGPGAVVAAVIAGTVGLVLGFFHGLTRTVFLAKLLTPALLVAPCAVFFWKSTLSVPNAAAEALGVGALIGFLAWLGFNAGVVFENAFSRSSLTSALRRTM